MIELICRINFSKNDYHVHAPKDETGYNDFGIHYRDNIKSLDIKLHGSSKNEHTILEAGGTTFSFNNHNDPLHVYVDPCATNFVHIPK